MKSLILTKGPLARRRILLVVIAGVPVLFLRMVNDPINVPKLALLFLGVVLVVAIKLLELIQGAPRATLRRAWFPAVAVVGPLAIGWAASPYRGWALLGLYDRFQGLLPYLAVALLCVLVADAFSDDIEQIGWALAIAGAVTGLYAVVQVAGLDPLEWGLAEESTSAATSTIGNPNFTGAFLAMVLPLTAALWIERPDKRRVLAGMTIAVVAGWLVAFSQGGWAAGAAGLAVGAGVFLSDRVRFARTAGVAVAVLIALAVVGQVLLGVTSGGGPLVPGTVLLRSDAWKGAVAMTADSPFVGRGPNAYAIEGTQYRTQEDAVRLGYDYPNDPHSVFLAMSTAAGILGAIGFLALVVWFARRAALVGPGDPWGAAMIGGTTAYLVQSLVSIDELSLRVTAWALLGALAVITTRATDEPEPATASRRKARAKRPKNQPLRNPVAVGAVGVAVLLGVWFTGRFFMADVHALRGEVKTRAGFLNDGTAEFDAALGLRDAYEYRRLLGLRVGSVAARSIPDGERFVDPVVEAFGFTQDFPHVSSVVEQARVLNGLSVFDETMLLQSLESWQRAHRLDPMNPLIAVEMTAVLGQLDRYPEARQELEPYADDVGDRLPQYWGALALSRAHDGDRSAAREAANKALAMDPEDPWAREAEIVLEGGE